MKKRALFCVLSILLSSVAWANPLLPQDVTVVRPECKDWMAQYAAEEFAKYAKAMGIVPVTLADRAPKDAAGVVVTFAVGEVKALESLPGADDPDRLVDGFTVTGEGKNRLHFASPSARGLMYAVYHYLENRCDVGFFWEGDHVSKLTELPVEGVNIREIPRWPVRNFALSNTWGLRKFNHQFRTVEHRQQIMGWMAKRKINLSSMMLTASTATAGLPAKEVLGIDDTQPSNTVSGGWPGDRDFLAKDRTAINLAQMKYGGQRGIAYTYLLDAFYPRTPENLAREERLLRACFDVYGTSHFYQGGIPFVESTMADSPAESARLKIDVLKQLFASLQRIDPKTVYVWDTWDITALSTVWTPERIKELAHAIPKDNVLIYDLVDFVGEHKPAVYEWTNYLYGAPFTVAILHSFQGESFLHGDMPAVLKRLQTVSQDPAASNCRGIFHAPETNGHNTLYFDFTTRLAWNPDDVTLEDYLDAFAKRRYGREDAAAMRAALGTWVSAIHSDFVPYYYNANYAKMGEPRVAYNWPVFPTPIGEPAAPHSMKDKTRLAEMASAIEAGLACRATQQDNPFYVEDMTEWTKGYVELTFNWALLEAYKAFKAGDVKRTHEAAAAARTCMKQIKNILSTRPDYYLQPQIDEAMRVPGANPYNAWYIKQHCVNWLYTTNDCYEQMHWYYMPRTELYLSELEQRVANGVKIFEYTDVKDRFDAIEQRWLNEDINVPIADRCAGTTLEALQEAMRTVSSIRPLVDASLLAELKPYEVPANAILIDPNSAATIREGEWICQYMPSAYFNIMYWTAKGEGKCLFTWKLANAAPGTYEVKVWVPENPGKNHASDQRYTVHAGDGVHEAVVDFSKNPRTWQSLGAYPLDASSTLVLSDRASGFVSADAVMLLPAAR